MYGNVGVWFNELLFLCYEILYYRQMFLIISEIPAIQAHCTWLQSDTQIYY